MVTDTETRVGTWGLKLASAVAFGVPILLGLVSGGHKENLEAAFASITCLWPVGIVFLGMARVFSSSKH